MAPLYFFVTKNILLQNIVEWHTQFYNIWWLQDLTYRDKSYHIHIVSDYNKNRDVIKF